MVGADLQGEGDERLGTMGAERRLTRLCEPIERRVASDMKWWRGRPRSKQRPYISWWKHFDPWTWDFCGPFHFMLYHGSYCYGQAHPEWCAIGTLGRCGQNAIRLALTHPGLT